MTAAATGELTREQAMQHINDMLLICQKFRSNLDETIKMLDPEADKEHVEQIHEELFPWLGGEKDVTPALIEVAMGTKPLTGQGFYNFMYIAHELCKPIALAAKILFGQSRGELPEPDTAWCAMDLNA